MSSRNLFEPITDNGIQNTNFFNGRLLTADDLAAVLGAGREHDRQLGKAIGEGVVHGLEVELADVSPPPPTPVVRVSGGLALCRGGSPVALSVPTVDVALARSPQTFAPEAGLFAECPGQGPGPADDLSNLGLYVFVASPASAFEGSVPMRHSVTSDRVDRCGRRFAVEGVKFRLERVDFSKLPGVSAATRKLLGALMAQTDEAGVSKLRSVVAHLCFDSETATAQRRDPFGREPAGGPFVNYGALAELRAAGQLTDCDVPLAVVYWTAQGVRFVDNWAARRLARRQLDSDVLSLLRGYGYERLLQFQRHLRDLFDKLGALSTLQLQNFFAYVPPAGFFPVTGVKSPRGFHPTLFFRQFTTGGSAGDATAESFGALLRESFACPGVALSSEPLFELYRVRDNSAAVAAGASEQLHFGFVSRALSGPLSRDGVASTLYNAWEVYRGVIKRRLFVLPYEEGAFLGANFGLVAAVNDVLFMSNRQYVLAAARRLDAAEALKAFAEMHRVQLDFVQFLLKGIPFPDRTGGRGVFAEQLAKLLGTGTGGKAGLLAAVNAGNLPAAVEAQDAINKFIGGWKGEGIVIGPFGSVWLPTSPGGKNLVPGEGPFEHHFSVNNGNDRALLIGLEAVVESPAGLPPKGDWDGSLKVVVDGVEADSVEVAANGKKVVSVFVSPPPDAEFGQQVSLTLKTTVGGATNKTTQSSVLLNVERATAPPVPHDVRFDGPVTPPTTNPANEPAKDPANARSNSTYKWEFGVRYTKSEESPAQARVRMTVNLSANMAEGWAARILDTTGATTTPPGTSGVFVREFDLMSGSTKKIPVIISTPANKATFQRECKFNVKVESVNLEPQVSDTHPDTFTITVKSNQ